MSLTNTSDWWSGEINWDTPAGALLQRFFQSLPRDRRFHFTLYGSAPLQLTLDRSWLSADVGLFSNDDEDLVEWVRRAGLAKEQTGFYLEPGFPLSFRTSPRWQERARNTELGNVRITVPHPLDILIGKLDRLDPKDLETFRMVIRLTGHPTADEFKRELQNAVDLFRPSFDDESPNRYPDNTRRCGARCSAVRLTSTRKSSRRLWHGDAPVTANRRRTTNACWANNCEGAQDVYKKLTK